MAGQACPFGSTGRAACLLLVLWSAAVPARQPGCPFVDAPGPPLNSERIERCFGSYGVALQEPVRGLRVARLYSREAAGRVCRTLALTGFVANPPAELAPLLARIRAGASLGKTLADAGWAVEKRSVAVRSVGVTQGFRELSGLGDLPANAPLAMHVYRLIATRGDTRVLLARVAEIHHPDYLDVRSLRRIRPVQAAPSRADRAFLARVADVLASPSR